ncbi:TetR/AcrR family transcriptional regulator [Leifsonia sp. F6_8S_P_1B]|uniref:TetR/AcrR family transcriptional regulator n=1 Tax=Leifsonia williamsii TaxID=3035919 RepID=A0ABT8K8H1_9MICO|nr:TetR/AcrR family transcriptional regulator [Leifsonia williamsii]MDN4613327.1 TetR/AcrR family transcriptional regulator [Leifsonia williamsii]
MADEEVRRRIVDAADGLYYAKGFHAVGMDEIRDSAGVSLRKLYGEFPSKDELILAVLDKRHRMWTDGVAARVATTEGAEARLLAIYDYLADWFVDDAFRGCGFINAFGELGAADPQVAEAARTHKESFQRYVADLAREAGAGPALAPQLAILAEGAQTTAAIAGTPDAAADARAAAEVLIRAALAGSGARS